jgi:hypothetical protein
MMRTAFRSSSSRLSQDAEKEIATEQRFSVLTSSSSRPPLQCPLHCALHWPQHQADETAVAPEAHHPATAGTASARTNCSSTNIKPAMRERQQRYWAG